MPGRPRADRLHRMLEERSARAAAAAGAGAGPGPAARPPDAYRDPVTWTVAAAVGGAYLVLSLFRLLQLTPSSWDLGIYTEYVKQFADLRAPIVDVRGPGFNLLGDHFQVAVALIAPFFRVFPSPATLLAAQALLAAVSVLPVTQAAVALLGRGAGRAVGAAYGFSWGLQQMIDFDFHEIALAVPLLAFSLSALVRGRTRAAVAWAVPLVFVKEDQGFTIAAIGLLMLLAGLRAGGAAGAQPGAGGGRFRPIRGSVPGGCFLIAWGLAWSLLAITVIIPHFNAHHQYLYWSDGGVVGPGAPFSAAGLIRQTLHAWPVKLQTVAMLLLPTAFTALGSPVALVAVPSLALRFISTNSAYWGTLWHYNATVMPVLFIAAAGAMGRWHAMAPPEPAAQPRPGLLPAFRARRPRSPSSSRSAAYGTGRRMRSARTPRPPTPRWRRSRTAPPCRPRSTCSPRSRRAPTRSGSGTRETRPPSTSSSTAWTAATRPPRRTSPRSSGSSTRRPATARSSRAARSTSSAAAEAPAGAPAAAAGPPGARGPGGPGARGARAGRPGGMDNYAEHWRSAGGVAGHRSRGKEQDAMPQRIAIVTGAARGIGAGTAKRLASDGMAVAVLDLSESDGQHTVAEIEKAGGRAIAVGADVSDAEQVKAAVDAVVAGLGEPTVLVNNAGVTRDNLLFKMSDSDWDTVLNVHLRGAFLMTRAVQQYMVSARWGRIVNLSSVSAVGNRGQVNYSAAKAGMQGFTKTLAIELGKFGITANAVAPGFIATDMTAATAARLGLSFEDFQASAAKEIPVQRVGQPEDVAAAISFFVSEEASFISGQVLYIAGGPVS